MLTTFMSCDVLPFEKWIKSGFDRVLSGKSEYEEVNGNVCCAEISPKTTKVYDNLAEMQRNYLKDCRWRRILYMAIEEKCKAIYLMRMLRVHME